MTFDQEAAQMHPPHPARRLLIISENRAPRNDFAKAAIADQQA
jgi:hypothetical protein